MPLQAAVLPVSLFMGLMVGDLVFGRLADLYGRKTVMYCCTGLTVAVTLGGAMATSFWPHIALRFLSGVFRYVRDGALIGGRDKHACMHPYTRVFVVGCRQGAGPHLTSLAHPPCTALTPASLRPHHLHCAYPWFPAFPF